MAVIRVSDVINVGFSGNIRIRFDKDQRETARFAVHVKHFDGLIEESSKPVYLHLVV